MPKNYIPEVIDLLRYLPMLEFFGENIILIEFRILLMTMTDCYCISVSFVMCVFTRMQTVWRCFVNHF